MYLESLLSDKRMKGWLSKVNYARSKKGLDLIKLSELLETPEMDNQQPSALEIK